MKQLIPLFFLLLFFVSNSFLSFGQASDLTLLHLDKSYYVTGEIVWYKFHLPKTYEGKTVTLEVVISDAEGKSIKQYFLQNEGQSYVESYYKIPFNMDAGWYRLSIFPTGDIADLNADELLSLRTQMPNLSTSNIASAISSAIFPIYNDLKPNQEIAAGVLPANENANLEGLQITLDLDQTTYSPRDEVALEIGIQDQTGNPISGNIAVSVSDSRLIDRPILAQNQLTAYLGDEIAVKGTLLNEQNQAMRASVLGMYSSLEDRIFYSSADANGRFNFKPPPFYGVRPVQFIGYQFEHMEIGVDVDQRQLPPIEQPLIYTEAVKSYLALSQQRKKIFQLYQSLENKIEPDKIDLDILNLEPSTTFIIDEYESFEFMHSFFGELLTPLKFILQKDSTYIATMSNPTGRLSANTTLSGTPLFIIDGKLTRDADFVARLDMDYIQKVELMFKPDNLRKKFKAIGRSGVVKITTNLRDIPMAEKDAADLFTISGLQPNAEFPVFDANTVDSKQPFFRPQLYWNPTLKSDKNGKAKLSFYQSDDISSFVVRVVVQGENGAYGYAEQMYVVRVLDN